MANKMPTRQRIILGLMNIGPESVKGARITSKDEFVKILDYFQAQGFIEIDTAQMYLDGEQERWTGAEANWVARGLKLATKLYPKPPTITHKAVSLRQHLNASLESLHSDYVDIFYLHAPDRTTLFSETLQELDSLHKSGRFRALGLSNFAAFEVAEVMTLCETNNWVRPTIYQGMYNILTRAIEPELIFACRKYGLDIVAYNPLAGGLLTGKYRSVEDFDTDGRFTIENDQGRRYRQRYFRANYFEAIQLLENAGELHSISLAEMSIRWLSHHSQLRMGESGPDGILIGISSFEHLKNNLEFLDHGPLPQAIVEAAEKSWELVKVNCPNYWHGELGCYS